MIRRALAVELAGWRSLARWLARRPDVPPGAAAFSYLGAISPVLWTFVVLSAVELVALHLVLPWPAVRLVADVLGVWGLVWMLGFRAGFAMHPHAVGPAGLRIRQGAGTDLTVPWEAVGSVAVRERTRNSSGGVQRDGDVLHVVVASRTNVDVQLRRPLAYQDGEVTGLRFLADDPRGLVARARDRLAAARGAE